MTEFLFYYLGRFSRHTKLCHDIDCCNCSFSIHSYWNFLPFKLKPAKHKDGEYSIIGIKTDLNILKISQKNGLKIYKCKTHQIPPNLKFCLSLSKEKKILFVLKQFSFIFRDMFLFSTAIHF